MSANLLARAEALARSGLTRENIYVSLLADIRALNLSGSEIPPQAELSAAITRGHAPRYQVKGRSEARAPMTRKRAHSLKERQANGGLPSSESPIRLLKVDEDLVVPVLLVRSTGKKVRVLLPTDTQTTVPRALLIWPSNTDKAWAIFKKMRTAHQKGQ